MNNYKNKVWSIIAGIVFVLTMVASGWLLVKASGLSMLPEKYLWLAISVVVFLLLIIFVLFFLLKGKKYVLRAVGMILAIALLVVDVAGVQMIKEFQNTISNMTADDEEEQVKEFVVGVYVRADDKAASLEDVKRYHMGYSLSYDRNNTRKAVAALETEVERNLNLEEYSTVISMVDAVLNKEKDGFILSSAYISILEEQEGYQDISDKVKCIYECVVTSEMEAPAKVDTTFDVTQDAFLVYISGTDTRGSGLQNVRNDVNLLAAVNPVTKQILLINTPRDSYVEISVAENGERDKLTHCGIYGIDCSLDTLENLYDEDIRYYTQINFKGFTRLIDAIGGVEIYSSKELYTTEGGHYIKKGKNILKGEAALAYARDRFSYGDGDRARGRNQMDIVKGIIKKMSSGALLKNYADILDSMGRYFACNLTEEEISALVKMQLNDMSEWDVKTYTITGKGHKDYSYSMPTLKAYVLNLDEASVNHAKGLIDMIYQGESITDEDLKLAE